MILVRLFAAAEAAAGTGTEKVEAATLGELKAISWPVTARGSMRCWGAVPRWSTAGRACRTTTT